MKFFNNPQAQKIKPKAPREMPEIEREYSELLSKAAQAQYLVYVHTRSLEELNLQLLGVNEEAAARGQLNNQAAKSEAKTEEATNG
jgi:hypothetical protein